MKKQGILVLFFVCLALNILAAETGTGWLQYLTKPLLMPALMLFFSINTGHYKGPLKKWVLLALGFSMGGDVLLMFQDRLPDFFLFGLSAFLLAHIFYIFFFHQLRVSEGIRGKPLWLIPVVIYYAGLMVWLSPRLGEMATPVRIYGLVISFMLVMALHMLYLRKKEAGRLMLYGALLFVASDSLLAINRFYMSFPLAATSVMSTYGMAQFLIVRGALMQLAGIRK